MGNTWSGHICLQLSVSEERCPPARAAKRHTGRRASLGGWRREDSGKPREGSLGRMPMRPRGTRLPAGRLLLVNNENGGCHCGEGLFREDWRFFPDPGRGGGGSRVPWLR